MQKTIISALRKITGEKEINLEFPENDLFGDYSSNIALILANERGVKPRKLAQEIVTDLNKVPNLARIVDKIEVAGPGFINFWLKKDVLVDNLMQIDRQKDNFGKSNLLKGKKILIEHTSPNPQTTIMLGHLRNNFLGMTVSNLLTFQGAKVIKDAIVNDRGIHICRSIWGYLNFASKTSGLTMDELINYREISEEKIDSISSNKNKWRELLDTWVKDKSQWITPQNLNLKPDHANLIWYVLGSKSFKKFENVERQVKEILVAWESEDAKVWKIWKQVLDWSAKGYEETYKRIGSVHDWVWYESDLYKGGREFVQEGLKEGIFQESKGAVVTNLEKYGLVDTVVIKSDGTSTYMVFDLNLTNQKMKRFPSDLYIWTIGMEQSLYFKQMFAVCEQLGLGKRDQFYHLAYALINFKGGGKMATREGSVVMADEILNELEKRVSDIIKSSNQELRAKLSVKETRELIKIIVLAAIKYSLLKVRRETTIFYDINESISLEGDSGPYLQYTVARTQSVLQKALGTRRLGNSSKKLVPEELAVLRTLVRFPEIIESAAKNYSPNVLCNYLFGLAQKFNNFYNIHRIIDSGNEGIRLRLTSAVGQVLKNGLRLLGIQTPERM